MTPYGPGSSHQPGLMLLLYKPTVWKFSPTAPFFSIAARLPLLLDAIAAPVPSPASSPSPRPSRRRTPPRPAPPSRARPRRRTRPSRRRGRLVAGLLPVAAAPSPSPSSVRCEPLLPPSLSLSRRRHRPVPPPSCPAAALSSRRRRPVPLMWMYFFSENDIYVCGCIFFHIYNDFDDICIDICM
jgi:hypothetical protein